MRRRVLRLLAAAIAVVIPGTVHALAETAVTVVDLGFEDGDRPPRFTAGLPFYLNPTLSVPPGLQVRFFCAAKKDLLRHPHGVSADHRCWTYESSVWKPAATDGQLRFGNIPFEWVVGPGGKVQNQTYFLVFEDGDLPGGTIQILKDQVPVYFNSGVHILFQAPADAAGFATHGTPTGNRGSGGPPICLEVAEIRHGAVRFAAVKGCRGAGRNQPAAASASWQQLMPGWGALAPARSE